MSSPFEILHSAAGVSGTGATEFNLKMDLVFIR
jgi:hypothetical protein